MVENGYQQIYCEVWMKDITYDKPDVKKGSSNKTPLGAFDMRDLKSLWDNIVMKPVYIYDPGLYTNDTSYFYIDLLQCHDENNDNENSYY